MPQRLPQIKIIDYHEYRRANNELIKDDPGNTGQTFDEYVNMAAVDLTGEVPNSPVVSHIDISSNPKYGTLIAVIHYTILT